MSLGQALATATAGLRVTQAGLSLTAANVANAETPGYVKKSLAQVTTAAAGSGSGVRVDAINRVLDTYLQRQVRVEASGGSYADMRAQFYSRLQQTFGAPGSDTSLDTIFNNFTSALQALSTSPDDASARSAVLNSAQVLTQQLNSMTSDVQGLRGDAELGLSDAVSQANTAMKQIAAINQQLASSSATDAASASLLDQRDNYIDQLSQLMDIKVVATDHNQVNVFTNSGIQLVGRQASQLAFNPQGTMTATAQWNADPSKSNVGTLSLISPTGGNYDLLANKAIRSGEIAAYVELRDQVLVEAQTQLDAIASAMASALSDKTTVSTTTASSGSQTGYSIDTAGLLAGNVIHLSYTDNNTGKQHNVSIVRVDDPSALPLSNDATLDPNDEVIGVSFAGGLSSVAAQLTSRFNGRLNFDNPSGTTLRILNDGANTTSVNSVATTKTVAGLSGGSSELPFFTDAGTPYTGAFTSLGSQSIGLAGRIVVNASLLADPTKLVSYQTGTPAGDATRPNFIYNQLTQASLGYSPETGIGSDVAPFSGNLPNFLRQMLSSQGEAADNATKLADGQDVVVNALKQRVAEGSSVNIDEEMANLLNLQTAYGANARILSVVKEMFDTLLKM